MVVGVAIDAPVVFNRIGHVRFVARFTRNRFVLVFKWKIGSRMVEGGCHLNRVETLVVMTVAARWPKPPLMGIYMAIGATLKFHPGELLEWFSFPSVMSRVI